MRGKSEKNEQEANSDIGKIAVGDVRTSVCQIKVYDQGKRKSVADHCTQCLWRRHLIDLL